MKIDVTKDYKGELISLEEAKEKGLKFFFTGQRCKHGHLSPRYLHRACMYCQLIKAEQQRLSDPEKHKQAAKDWRSKNPDRVKANWDRWELEHGEYLAEKSYHRYWSDPEGNIERSSAWLKDHPGYSTKKSKEHYWNDPEKAREQRRNWVENNPNKIKTCKQKDYKNNYETYAQHRRKRRALKRNAQGSYTTDQFNTILKSQGYKCYYCRQSLDMASKPKKYHEEHLIPLIRGGSNWPENIVAACSTCNISKRDSTHVEFLKSPRFQRRMTKVNSVLEL